MKSFLLARSQHSGSFLPTALLSKLRIYFPICFAVFSYVTSRKNASHVIEDFMSDLVQTRVHFLICHAGMSVRPDLV